MRPLERFFRSLRQKRMSLRASAHTGAPQGGLLLPRIRLSSLHVIANQSADWQFVRSFAGQFTFRQSVSPMCGLPRQNRDVRIAGEPSFQSFGRENAPILQNKHRFKRIGSRLPEVCRVL